VQPHRLAQSARELRRSTQSTILTGPLGETLDARALEGMSARERTKPVKRTWDPVGSARGGRVELYEPFYLTSAARNFALDHFIA
jgi:aromatic ring hydroxylase